MILSAAAGVKHPIGNLALIYRFPGKPPRMDPLFGVINLNKPSGLTSRSALNRLQKRLGKARVGHGGTLDPLARGVLLVLVGKATRLMPYVHHLPKCYLAGFRFGWMSDTEDVEGELKQLVDPPIPLLEQVHTQLELKTGTLQQRPPAYSALKVKGQRAYRLARRGEKVELPAREVVVHRLELVSYDYPDLVLKVECGGGTYVRSLGRDIAEALGTAAVMTELTRTAVGGFCLEEALGLEELDTKGPDTCIQPARLLVPQMPGLEFSDEQWQRLACGQSIPHPGPGDKEWAEAAALDKEGELLGIVGPAGDGQIRPLKSFRV